MESSGTCNSCSHVREAATSDVGSWVLQIEKPGDDNLSVSMCELSKDQISPALDSVRHRIDAGMRDDGSSFHRHASGNKSDRPGICIGDCEHCGSNEAA